jgi:hypothetical protein
LLNNGETYSVPVYLEEQYNAFGIQYRATADVDKMDIIDNTSDYATEGLEYYVTEDGILTLMFSTIDPMEGIGGTSSDPVFNIELTAKENSLLSLAMDMESHLSYLATTSFDLVVLGDELDGMIGTGTNSIELNSLSVYPNPTVDYLTFDRKKVRVIGGLEVSVFGLDGRKLFTRDNVEQLDVSDLNAGMYYYQVKVDSYATTGKFIVIDR